MAKAEGSAGLVAPSKVTSTQGAKVDRPANKPIREAATGASSTDDGPALIIFGRDEKGNGHAAWFAAPEAELAERAAAMMGYKAIRVTSEALRAKALELTAGKIFGSGKALSPFCRLPLLEALEALPGAFKPQGKGDGAPRPLEALTDIGRHGQKLRVGSVVLATVGDGQGWFEAVIAEDRGEALYVLTWVGWPDDGSIVRRADALAMLPPKAAQAPAG